MIRGFVYSFVAISIYLLVSILWLESRGALEEGFPIAAGWVLLIGMFAIGPGFFMLGYWHNMKLNPDKPHWDPEMGE